MVEQSKVESVGTRLGTYVEELREFFHSRAVRYGSPEDLPAFAERVSMPGAFQDEMGSLVRSIFFRESENLGRAELLEIVTVAVGGPGVEMGTQGLQSSVRQVFVFVNAALRQHHGIPSGEADAPTAPQVTAGDILAAPYGLNRREETVVAAKTPEDGSPEAVAPREATPVRTIVARGVPVNSGSMLFKAISASEAQGEPEDDLPRPDSRANRWLVPAVMAGVIAVGLGGYSLRTVTGRPSQAGLGAGSGDALSQPANGLLAGTCVNAPSANVTRASMQERARWAHNLLDQKLYEAALPELREVARLDPGFPGVNLDLSNALMQMKRPEEAREAVDTQIALSECLAKLPSPSLDAYCSAEFPSSTVAGCRPQLAHIRQSAELQEALVHLELGHRVAPDIAAAASSAAVTDREPSGPTTSHPHAASAGSQVSALPHRVAPLPPATEGDADQPAPVRTEARAKTPAAGKATGRKSSADDSLMRGEGTDSAFGAYSKPQEP